MTDRLQAQEERLAVALDKVTEHLPEIINLGKLTARHSVVLYILGAALVCLTPVYFYWANSIQAQQAENQRDIAVLKSQLRYYEILYNIEKSDNGVGHLWFNLEHYSKDSSPTAF